MITDLELWLIGPPAALDAAARALAGIGHVRYHTDREPRSGQDTGRSRTYARVYVPTRQPADPVDDAADGW